MRTSDLSPIDFDRDRSWLITCGFLFLLLVWLNPVGFMGGWWDDYRYLDAARCWAATGPCLPQDHWQGRWPIVAPIGAAIAILGESRASIAIPSVLYSAGSIFCIAWLGNRAFGRPVGYVASIFMLLTPDFTLRILQPNIDQPELFFLLTTAVLTYAFIDRRDWRLSMAAGVAFGLAFQARETAITAAPILAYIALKHSRGDWRPIAAAAIGAVAPLLIEFLIYIIAAGDPFWRRGLSVAHTNVYSPELYAPIDEDEPPFFNKHYIANWNHRPGFAVHWMVDGPLNLALSISAGVTLLMTPLLTLTAGRWIDVEDRKAIWKLLAVAAYWIAVLTYAFAVHPKPRMMYFAIAIANIGMALLVVRLWQKDRKPLVMAIGFMATSLALLAIAGHQRVRDSEPVVAGWIADAPGQIEADLNTRKHLALVPLARELPDVFADKPLLLIKLDMNCSDWATQHLPGKLEGPIERSPLGPFEPLIRDSAGSFCLFRYREPVQGQEILDAKEAFRAKATMETIVAGAKKGTADARQQMN